MSKKIYEDKVYADAAKRFRMLCEYTFNITEDDGEDDMQPESDGENQNGMNNSPMPSNDNMGDAPEMGNNPEMGNEPGMGDASEMGNEPGMGNNPNPDGQGQNNTPTGFNPEENMDDMGDMGDVDESGEDDTVIDVDDLTQSQEDTEKKVDGIKSTMNKGFKKLLNIVDKLDKMIDNNTAHMEEIKQEIERRNPTPMEKLNMRAANNSYPFNVSPSDYWNDKEANSNYRIGEDNLEDENYIIRQSDLNNITDFQKISQELNDSSFNQNLMNIFGLR